LIVDETKPLAMLEHGPPQFERPPKQLDDRARRIFLSEAWSLPQDFNESRRIGK